MRHDTIRAEDPEYVRPGDAILLDHHPVRLVY
jgi:hypothetical protein